MPPFAEELWGSGGYPKRIQPNSVNFVAMSDMGEPINVEVGDKFFVSMRVNHPQFFGGFHLHPEEARTEWDTYGFRVTTADEDYPSRNWKFYEHDKGPSNCAGAPIDSIRRGWVARGGFGYDTLDVAAFNFWYVITVRSNVPPVIEDVMEIYNTFDAGPYPIAATLTDCNLVNPGEAGIAGALIRYTLNENTQPDIPMAPQGGDVWSGVIPAQPAGTTICYTVVATDQQGAYSSSTPICFRVSPFGNQWYSIDTSGSCNIQSIRSTGTLIDTSDYFLPPTALPLSARKDDGTAGPFDMGGDFIVFGDTFRYAWVGINGAISLSRTPADTHHLNSSGVWSAQWDFPYNQPDMPPIFIAPMWADLLISADSPAAELGKVVYGNNGNGCQFIVEWDSIATFDGFYPYPATFRVLLNRCDGTIEFQYQNVGTAGLDALSLVGMQGMPGGAAGPEPAWLFVNRFAQPYLTKPRDNWCIKLRPVINNFESAGWHLISLPYIPVDGDYSIAKNIPNALLTAWPYITPPGYGQVDSLSIGKGYWIKTYGTSNVAMRGYPLDSTTIPVNDRWNLIGSVASPLSTASIIAGGGTSILTPYFDYQPGSGYVPVTIIEPGRAYWVKASGAGSLFMQAPPEAPMALPKQAALVPATLSVLSVVNESGEAQRLYLGRADDMRIDLQYFELPPAPPGNIFDARFGSGRMIETYEANAESEFPILLSSPRYPLTIRWEGMTDQPYAGLVVDGTAFPFGSRREIRIEKPAASIAFRIGSSRSHPTAFKLEQNYPNPFNPVTRISYEVSTTSVVSLKVFNTLGEEVATLVEAVESPGFKDVVWDAANAPSGVYYVRMVAGSFRETKKMLLLR